MKPPDQQIRSFLRIAELKSISSAAEALDLSQSGLSKQLHQLEAHLGQSLFERTGRGVALTDAGDKLYAAAAAAFGTLDRAVEQLKTTEGVTEGALRVAAVHTLNAYFMPGLLCAFLAQRPRINVSMLSRSSPEVVALLDAGKVDIGFVYDTAVASSEVSIHPLFTEEMVLFHRGEHDAGEAGIDLAQQAIALVCFPAPYALRSMLDRSRVRYHVAAEVETLDAMLKLVLEGLGACILPDRLPPDLIEARGLRRTRIANPVLQRRVVGIARNDKPLSPLTSLMLSIAAKTA